MIQLLWKIVWQALEILNIELPYDSAIPFLSIHPRELKICVYIKTCTQMLIIILFRAKEIAQRAKFRLCLQEIWV